MENSTLFAQPCSLHTYSQGMQILHALRGGSRRSEDNFCKESLRPPAAVFDPLGGPKRGWPKVRPLSFLHAVSLWLYKGRGTFSVTRTRTNVLIYSCRAGG